MSEVNRHFQLFGRYGFFERTIRGWSLRWRPVELNFNWKRWWHLGFRLGPSFCSEHHKAGLSFHLLGFSVYWTLWFTLNPKKWGDVMQSGNAEFSLALNEHNFHFQIWKWRSNWEYPFRWDHAWTKLRRIEAPYEVVQTRKSSNWYVWKWRKLCALFTGKLKRNPQTNWDEEERLKAENSISLPYRYTCKNGDVQDVTATICLEEGCWKPLLFPIWPSWVRRSINIHFSDEVGERRGSWKGGCIGCSYHLNPGETPEQCLRRMEKERKFDR